MSNDHITSELPVAIERQAWTSPRLLRVSGAKESEAGILVGPEILILLS